MMVNIFTKTVLESCKRLCVCLRLETFFYTNFKDKPVVDVSDLDVIFVHFKCVMFIC